MTKFNKPGPSVTVELEGRKTRIVHDAELDARLVQEYRRDIFADVLETPKSGWATMAVLR